MERLPKCSKNIVNENIEKIRSLFPNAVTETEGEDGKIRLGVDFDVLRQELSNAVIEEGKRRYQMTWPGKRATAFFANEPTDKVLRPIPEKSLDFDKTKNVYIEGDNLEVLKILREAYLGKVKMIYIDPPYNTGNDFVYHDDFKKSGEEYLEETGQVDEEGNRLQANPESNGRFHTDWLNMIYSRLILAKDFLTEDGVIFISIGENEVGNLRKVCDEVFGQDNYVATFPWRKRTAKSDVPFGVSQDYDWILAFARSGSFKASIEGKTRTYYETPDFPNRPWRTHDLTTQRTASERPNSYFTIVNPKNGEQYPCNPNRTWCVTKETFKQYYEQGRIVFPGDYDFLKISKPVLRYFKDDDMKKAGDDFGKVAVSTLLPSTVGLSSDGTKEVTDLFGAKVFSYPKPSSLIRYLISVSTNPDSIVMDFFSGSASSAQAVMEQNALDNGHRQFIMVQLEEECEENSEAFKAGYKTICEIGEERIRRAGQKIVKENPLLQEQYDLGFRVFKVDSNNFKDVSETPAEMSLIDKDINIKEDRTSLDLLFQSMITSGLPLSAKIEKKEFKNGKGSFYLVNDTDMAACFENNISVENMEQIANCKPAFAIFKDGCFANDSDCTNCYEIFKTLSPSTGDPKIL